MSSDISTIEDVRNSVGSEDPKYLIPIKFMSSKIKSYSTLKVLKKDMGLTFILDTTSNGILDQNKLDEVGVYDTGKYVISYNNTFVEKFPDTEFINTTVSNGTIDTTNGNYTLTGSQILQSDTIVKEDYDITYIDLSMEGTNTDKAKVYISKDDGASFTEYTQGSPLTLPSGYTDGIVYKISNESGGSFPTEWGTWGESSVPITIKQIMVRYS